MVFDIAYLHQVVETQCQTVQVDPQWVKAIIQQESAWNVWAVRYEPKYSWLFKPEIYAKSALISLDTEVTTQKISWGLGQLMGALCREQGFKGLMAELLDPEINIKQVCIRIAELKKISPDRDTVFAMYNGGPGARLKISGKFRNQEYVDSVNKHLAALGQ